jgi:hydroxyacylglutathione hydrolase
MIRHTLVLGPFQTNTYLLGCEATHEGIVIDPGFDAPDILAAIADAQLVIQAIVLTHGHVDHVSAVSEVKAATGAAVAIHQADQEVYAAAPQLGQYFGLRTPAQPAPDRLLAEGDLVTFGKVALEVLHTPGHSPGGICLHAPAEQLLVSGDTLFCRGVGRTDLPGGSLSALMRSIRQKLYVLDGATQVLPGHGPETTLREEMFSNPFVTM